MKQIQSLTLMNFRSYIKLQLNLRSTISVFIGNNGSGKSNLLEAISLLSPGRGMRKVELKNFSSLLLKNESIKNEINLNTNHWGCVFKIKDQSEDCFKFSIGNKKNIKQILLDNKKIRQSEMLNHIQIIWFTTDMMNILIGPKSNQRSFFDRLFMNIDSNYIIYLSRYEKLQSLRNAVLKNPNNALLDIYEKEMSDLSIDIYLYRNIFLKKINKIFNSNLIEQLKLNSYMNDIFKEINFKNIKFNNKVFAFRERNNIRSIISSKLKNSRFVDIYKPKFSIKRDCIEIAVKNKDDIKNCSTGEQKDILLELLIGTKIFNIFKRTNEINLILQDEYDEAFLQVIKIYNNINTDFDLKTITSCSDQNIKSSLNINENKINLNYISEVQNNKCNIFILDEVVAYFDSNKRKLLLKKIEFLNKLGVQILISGTSKDYFDIIKNNIEIFNVLNSKGESFIDIDKKLI